MELNNLKMDGICIELIQLFDEHALVQEVLSKKIYLIHVRQIDSAFGLEYNNIEAKDLSNVISLKGWIKCQRKTKKANKNSNLKKII